MSAAKNNRAGLPGYTGVNLLPDEIKQADGAATQRRIVVLLTVLVIVVVIAGFFGASLYAQGTQAQLVAAQAEAAQIVVDQAKYGGGQQVANQIKTAKDAQVVATSAEIDWAPVLTDVILATPPSISLTGFGLNAQTPVADGTPPGSPLETPRIGSLKLTAVTSTPSDIDAWVKSLEHIKGFSGSTVVRLDGGLQYTVMLYISDARLTNRFSTPAPGSTATPSPTPTATPTVTPTATPTGQG